MVHNADPIWENNKGVIAHVIAQTIMQGDIYRRPFRLPRGTQRHIVVRANLHTDTSQWFRWDDSDRPQTLDCSAPRKTVSNMHVRCVYDLMVGIHVRVYVTD